MNTPTAVQTAPRPQGAVPGPAADKNPWTSDTVLLSLSVWWVQMTRPQARDFSGEVAAVFDSLQRDLQ